MTKAYDETAVVRDVSFNVAPGDILALLGPSGCGKTTTLRLIAGFERLDAGQIAIAGHRVAAADFHLPPEKRRVGMVFQDYAIFPHLNVAANVAFGLGRGAAARARTAAMLRFVGLAGLEEAEPHALSGGQQQRVALARALAPEPAVLLLDEPFSNLDTSLRVQVRREVRDLLKAGGATAIFVTHDQEEALYIGDRVGVMRAGRLEQVGTPEQLFHRPQTRFVAGFLGQTDFVPGEVTAGGVITPLGTLPWPAGTTSLPVGTAVTIGCRPDDVRLLTATPGNGRVVDVRFTGIARLYEVVLAEGTFLHSWQPHTFQIAPGTAVAVAFRPGHAVTLFNGERAAATLIVPD